MNNFVFIRHFFFVYRAACKVFNVYTSLIQLFLVMTIYLCSAYLQELCMEVWLGFNSNKLQRMYEICRNFCIFFEYIKLLSCLFRNRLVLQFSYQTKSTENLGRPIQLRKSTRQLPMHMHYSVKIKKILTLSLNFCDRSTVILFCLFRLVVSIFVAFNTTKSGVIHSIVLSNGYELNCITKHTHTHNIGNKNRNQYIK